MDVQLVRAERDPGRERLADRAAVAGGEDAGGAGQGARDGDHHRLVHGSTDTLGASVLDHDLDPETRAWALARMRRMPLLDALVAVDVGASFTSHDWVGDIDVPTASVITVRDRVVAPRRQYKLARALADNTVIELDADHGAFLSSPDQFATALSTACDAVCDVPDTRWTTPDDLAS